MATTGGLCKSCTTPAQAENARRTPQLTAATGSNSQETHSGDGDSRYSPERPERAGLMVILRGLFWKYVRLFDHCAVQVSDAEAAPVSWK